MGTTDFSFSTLGFDADLPGSEGGAFILRPKVFRFTEFRGNRGKKRKTQF